MMTITTRHVKYVDDYKEYVWECDADKPNIPANETIVKLEADEAELDHILDNFSGIPIANTFPLVWRAPFAQFIYDNL